MLIAGAGVTAGALFGLEGVIAMGVLAPLVAALVGQRWFAVGVVAVVAALAGFVRVSLGPDITVDDVVVRSTRGEGVVASIPQIGPSGPRAVVEIDRVQLSEGDWVEGSGKVLVFFRDSEPHGVGRGDRVQLVWSVTDAADFDPGFRRFVAASDAAAGAWAFNTVVIARGSSPFNVLVDLREKVTTRITSSVEGDAGALLAGFVTGDDSGLSEPARDTFDRTNTSHITAVSGSNVAILLAMWYALVRSGRWRRSIPALLCVLTLIWLYVVLVGMGPGAVRAALFATLLFPAARFGRRADPMTALMAVSAAMLLASPGYAVNVGFWLSMAASAAMVTTLPAANQTTPWEFLGRGTVSLLAAQLATLPITFWVFGSWSPGSLVANLIVGPIVSLMFPVAFVTAAVVTVVPWVGGLIGWLPALGAVTIISAVQSLAGAFPMVRAGDLTVIGAALVAAICLAVVAVLSADVQRWLDRLAFRRSNWLPFVLPAMVGGAIGLWLVAVLVPIWV